MGLFEPEVLTIGTMKLLDPDRDCVTFGYCTAEEAATPTHEADNAHRAPGRFTPPKTKLPHLNYKMPSMESAVTSKNTGILRIVQVTGASADMRSLSSRSRLFQTSITIPTTRPVRGPSVASRCAAATCRTATTT